MLANVFFRNMFAFLNGGILPQTLATGTTSGSAIQLGGTAPMGKLVFIAQASMLASATSNSGTVAMYLATATASGGAYTSLSATEVSTSVSVSGSMFNLVIDTRNEAFANLGLATSVEATWVKPVLALATAAIPTSLTVLGWESGVDPASAFDGATTNQTEVDYY